MPTSNRKNPSTRKGQAASISRAIPQQAAPVAAAAPAPTNVTQLHTGPTLAQEVLRRAAETLNERGSQRDTAGGATAPQERNMERIVGAFNVIEGTNLTPRQGWAFMQMLKMARAATSARNGVFHADDHIDAAAYAALGHEAAEAEAAQLTAI